MNDYTTGHLSWETVNDYADARLGGEARRDAAAHLDQCAECRDLLAELRCLLAAASDVPEAIDPPPPLWGEIHASIAAKRDGAVIADVRDASVARARRPLSSGRLAAAAVLLVFVSSATTVLVMRRSAPPAIAPVASSSLATRPSDVTATPAIPASFANAEAGYLSNVESLQRAFERDRPSLSPSTVAVVERSLATIDGAIREARAALLADPSNGELARLLDSNYRKKVELLRRAADLVQRS